MGLEILLQIKSPICPFHHFSQIPGLSLIREGPVMSVWLWAMNIWVRWSRSGGKILKYTSVFLLRPTQRVDVKIYGECV